ncbi:hypothetical protein Acr_29g0012050 [Actinidia rufa]|uniref:Uncharacterized protein n=1 Tax=Actinidia rufa TaxID=165716 RepID=A0A7J0HFZ4_9ERIC|nr:hypothetical protein Acr_29g0012050 [Actinidia rufa]
MAGGNHPKGSTHKPSSSSSHSKFRWEESTTNSSPVNKPPSNDPNKIPKPSNPPPDPPHLSKPDPTPPGAPLPYGFHMLDRRTFVLFDSSVRSYFALPNYPDFGPIPRPGPAFSGPGIRFGPEFRDQGQDYWFDGRGGENSAKRKFGEERERDWREEKEGRGLNSSGLPMGVEFLPEIGGGDELRAAKYMKLGGGGWGL